YIHLLALLGREVQRRAELDDAVERGQRRHQHRPAHAEQREGLFVHAGAVLDGVGPGTQREFHRLVRLAVDGDRAAPAVRLVYGHRDLVLVQRRHPRVRMRAALGAAGPELDVVDAVPDLLPDRLEDLLGAVDAKAEAT